MRNFLHAAAIRFRHPRTSEEVQFAAPLPAELEDFLARLSQPRGSGAETLVDTARGQARSTESEDSQ